MGSSWGGFGVLALITQTNRFRAAIDLSGISNFSSIYGTFHMFNRYNSARQDYIKGLAELTEAGQVRMGSPPWVDPARYIRNSPLFYADQVNTPLMIIHGDMDLSVPIEQSEEFYTALYRQGKRAEFVRYFGEGHGIGGRENVIDMWQRIYAWLDEFLLPAADKYISP
jgi:dipeptidyl aminopeptidase/acylaminoacyl peptidase